MAEVTSSETRPPASKRRKVSGSRNRAQESKRAKSWKGGRHTVGGEKPQPKSNKVTISKDKISKVGSIINLLKRGSIYGYLLSEITNPQSVADGTMTAYRKRQKGEN